MILTDRTEAVLKKNPYIHREGLCVQMLELTNTVQDITKLTRFHGLHREKKLRK